MRPETFKRAMGRYPQRGTPFALSVDKGTAKLPPAALFHYWHPEREAVELCPREFDRQLKQIHPGLACCRPPAAVPAPCDQRWILWQRDETIRYYLCRGWKLLFLWPPKDFDPIPLDNRVFANLAIIDPRRYTSSVAYFDTIVNRLQNEHDGRDADHRTYLHDRWKDLSDTWKISSAGRGNRFALHHDGTVLPSRGERNRTRERKHLILPSDIERERQERGIGRGKF